MYLSMALRAGVCSDSETNCCFVEWEMNSSYRVQNHTLHLGAAALPPLSRTAATAHRASGGSAGLASKGCAPAGRASASRSSATAVQGRCRRSRRRGRSPVETSCSSECLGCAPSVANATAPLKGAPRLPRLYYSSSKIYTSLGVFSALASLRFGQRSSATPPSTQFSQDRKSIPNLYRF